MQNKFKGNILPFKKLKEKGRKGKKKWFHMYFIGAVICLVAVYFASYKISSEYFKHTDLAKRTKEELVEVTEANVDNEAYVTKNTVYIEETYDRNSGNITEEEGEVPIALLGLNKEKVIQYCDSYGSYMTEEEKKLGLQQCQLISFSKERIVIRKTYMLEESPSYSYYAILEENHLKVYYSDKKTLFIDTPIELTKMEEEIINELKEGVFIKSIWEVYGYLDEYSVN